MKLEYNSACYKFYKVACMLFFFLRELDNAWIISIDFSSLLSSIWWCRWTHFKTHSTLPERRETLYGKWSKLNGKKMQLFIIVLSQTLITIWLLFSLFLFIMQVVYWTFYIFSSFDIIISWLSGLQRICAVSRNVCHKIKWIQMNLHQCAVLKTLLRLLKQDDSVMLKQHILHNLRWIYFTL